MSMKTTTDDGRCPECHNSNVRFEPFATHGATREAMAGMVCDDCGWIGDEADLEAERDGEAPTPDHTHVAANYEETLEDFDYDRTLDLQRLAGEEVLGETIDVGEMARYATECINDTLAQMEEDNAFTRHDVVDAAVSAFENIVLARYNDTETPDDVLEFVYAYPAGDVYLTQGESPAVYGGRESDIPLHNPRSMLTPEYPL
jgi:rubredoxin